MTDESLTFTTLRPPSVRRLVFGWAQNAAMIVLLVLLGRRGGPRWPARVMSGYSIVMIPVSIATNVALWRSGPHRGRGDPRREVVIPGRFLGTFTHPEDTPEYRAFVSRLRSELGLNLADTALALATIGEHNRKLAADASARPA